ncbi:unnamed protein product, partial [Ectocarpus sp. 8 AP-2014]
MVESGVVSAMSNDPMLALVRQASADKQCSVPRGYTNQSELSLHWQCYLLALRTTSDLTRTIHASKALSSPLASNAVAARWTAGVASSSSSSSSSSAGGVSRDRMGPREAEAGLSQVFRFVDAFRETMVVGLSLVVSAPPTGGGRLTLAGVQESVDVAGVVAALGPWMSRWRAQHPGTSTQLLEAVRQATRTAAVLLVPATGPPATKSAATGGGSAATGQTPVRGGGGGGGGGWSSPVARRRSLEEFTPMQQATPTPARGAVGGGAAITPARPIAGGGAVVAGATTSGGGGGTGGGMADSRPLELVKACALAVTAEEKAALDNGGGGVSSSDGGGQYPCAMTMATPTPVHRGGTGGGGGGGGGAFAPLRAG